MSDIMSMLRPQGTPGGETQPGGGPQPGAGSPQPTPTQRVAVENPEAKWVLKM